MNIPSLLNKQKTPFGRSYCVQILILIKYNDNIAPFLYIVKIVERTPTPVAQESAVSLPIYKTL